MWIQGNHCPPPPIRPPIPRRKSGRILRSIPPFGDSTAPVAQDHHPHAELGGPHRLRLPVARQLGQKSAPDRRALRQDLVAAVAVVADRRGGDQHRRPLGQAPQLVHQGARADDAAVAQALLCAARTSAPRRSVRQSGSPPRRRPRRRRPAVGPQGVPGKERRTGRQGRGRAHGVPHQRAHRHPVAGQRAGGLVPRSPEAPAISTFMVRLKPCARPRQ